MVLLLVATFPLDTFAQEHQPRRLERGGFGNAVTPPIANVNWTDFWQIFNKHSAWDLEVNAGAGWVSVKEDLTIIRTYTNRWTCKLSLIFNASQTGDYRLTFAIDRRVQNYTYKEADHRYVLTYQNHTVFFDWSDLASLPALTFTHGITDVDGTPCFWFRVRRNGVSQGTYLELDPMFGYDTKGGDYAELDGIIRGSWFTMGDASGYADSITVYLTNEDYDKYVTCAVYEYVADNNAGALVGETEEIQISAWTDTWVTFSFSTPVPLNATTKYFLCAWGERGGIPDINIWYNAESDKGIYLQKTYDPPYPNPLTGEYGQARKYSLYCNYTVGPLIGNFACSKATVYNDENIDVNCTITSAGGGNTFVNTTVELSHSVILKWDNTTNVFSVYSDPNGYSTLSSGTRTTVNSTSYTLTWTFSLSASYPKGYVDLVEDNTIVYDDDLNTASASYNHLFTFSTTEPPKGGPTGPSGPYQPMEPEERPEDYEYEGPPYYYGQRVQTGPVIDFGLIAMLGLVFGIGVIGFVAQKLQRTSSRANLLKRKTALKRGTSTRKNLKRSTPHDYAKRMKKPKR